MPSLLLSYPPHLATFRLLLWACQACLDQSGPLSRTLGPMCAICLEPNRDDNPGARCRQLVSTHAGARGQTQGTHGRLDDQCWGESDTVPFADGLSF